MLALLIFFGLAAFCAVMLKVAVWAATRAPKP